MTTPRTPADKKSRREGAVTAVVILTLLGGVGCMLVERTWSRFRLATTIDFDAIPLAIEIPPEDLHRVRQPDYVLPKRGQKDKFAQLLDRIPEFSFASANETNVEANPGPNSVAAPPARPPLQTEKSTDLSRFQPDKPSAILATDARPQSAAIARVSYLEDRGVQAANDPIPETNDLVPAAAPPGPENHPKPRQPIPATTDPPRRDFHSDFDPAGRTNDFAGAQRPRTVSDLKFTSPESQTATALRYTDDSFDPARRSEPTKPAPTATVSDNETGSLFVPPFPQFAETLPPTLSATSTDAPKPTAAAVAATKTQENTENTVEPVRSADKQVLTVVAGDTLWELTERVYGDGRLFRAVFAANETILRGSSKLQPGTQLRFPSPEELVRRFPESIPVDLLESTTRPTYQTSAGDSLFSIARDELGQASRYLEILELNRDILPANVRHSDDLPIGLQLVLPHR